MTDGLKPVRCGCGGEAFTHILGNEIAKGYYIACDECGTKTKVFGYESEAVEAWNRAMRRAKVDVLPNTSEDKGEMPFCPHCGDELEWE